MCPTQVTTQVSAAPVVSTADLASFKRAFPEGVTQFQVYTAMHAQQLELVLCIRSLLSQLPNVEIIGEYQALDIQHKACKQMRESLNATITRARAAVATHTGC
ncbi:protein of unknown function [Pararobbsia alpina]|uniref:hypothetical protein n=1 Tax=Pararobbsia alpina TaxID=621374 RepID=UPI0039A5FE8F